MILKAHRNVPRKNKFKNLSVHRRNSKTFYLFLNTNQIEYVYFKSVCFPRRATTARLAQWLYVLHATGTIPHRKNICIHSVIVCTYDRYKTKNSVRQRYLKNKMLFIQYVRGNTYCNTIFLCVRL